MYPARIAAFVAILVSPFAGAAVPMLADDGVEHPPVAAGVLAWYLPREEGGRLSRDASTEEDPLGASTTKFEREDSASGATVARSGLLEPITIDRDGAFFLYLANREPLAGQPRTFHTLVDVFVERCPASFSGEVFPCASGMRVKDASGRDWSLGRAVASYAYGGGDVDRAENWTDIRFDATTTPPADMTPGIPGDEILVTNGTITIPGGKGYQLVVAFGLLSSPDERPAGFTQPVEDIVMSGAQTLDDSNVLPEQGSDVIACPSQLPPPTCPVAKALLSGMPIEDGVVDRVHESRGTFNAIDNSLGSPATSAPVASYQRGAFDAPTRLEIRRAGPGPMFLADATSFEDGSSGWQLSGDWHVGSGSCVGASSGAHALIHGGCNEPKIEVPTGPTFAARPIFMSGFVRGEISFSLRAAPGTGGGSSSLSLTLPCGEAAAWTFDAPTSTGIPTYEAPLEWTRVSLPFPGCGGFGQQVRFSAGASAGFVEGLDQWGIDDVEIRLA